MLGKILKYDCLFFSRKLMPIYIGLLIGAPIVYELRKFMPGYSEDTMSLVIAVIITALTGLFGAITFSVSILTVYVLMGRFSKIMTTNEGYLIHTLPVSPHKILLSQYINSIFWIILSIVIFIVSISMFSGGLGGLVNVPSIARNFFNFISDLAKAGIAIPLFWGNIKIEADNINVFLTLLPITAILAFFLAVSILYCSVCVGQLFKKYKVLGGIFVFLLMSTLIFLSNSVLSFFISPNQLNFNITRPLDSLIIMAIMFITMSVSMIVAVYFIIYYILKNHLNIN